MWRGIRKTWDKLLDGCRGKVGDDSTICFWSDQWLYFGHKLHQVVCRLIPQELLEVPLKHYYEEST